MNVPPATGFHRARARARLWSRPDAVVTWIVAGPGEDVDPYGAPAADYPVRESALELAENLAARKPALAFFVGGAPTHWPDLFDVAEIFIRAGAAPVLATNARVLNPMSAPVIAYHFTRIYVTFSPVPKAEEIKGLATLTALWPRAAVEARVFGPIAPALENQLRSAGAERVRSWPPAGTRPGTLIAADLKVTAAETPWAADHVWFPGPAPARPGR